MPLGVAIMKFDIILFQDEDGFYIAECPSIPGCIIQGPSEEQALESIRDAIRECLEVRKKRNLPLFIEPRQIEVQV